VIVVPNHICPVVDLFEGFHVVRDGVIVDRWRVDARGRSG
jgi:D-serine deaminase-like pyridoxal phosphate-dependent protein